MSDLVPRPMARVATTAQVGVAIEHPSLVGFVAVGTGLRGERFRPVVVRDPSVTHTAGAACREGGLEQSYEGTTS